MSKAGEAISMKCPRGERVGRAAGQKHVVSDEVGKLAEQRRAIHLIRPGLGARDAKRAALAGLGSTFTAGVYNLSIKRADAYAQPFRLGLADLVVLTGWHPREPRHSLAPVRPVVVVRLVVVRLGFGLIGFRGRRIILRVSIVLRRFRRGSRPGLTVRERAPYMLL
jgi:hypothetical protein